MPGVPSFRGCDACRELKKKAKPACSRCSRLQIPCVGCGAQRYRFMNQSVASASAKFGGTDELVRVAVVPWALANETTALAGTFTSVLEVTDVCFGVGIYGTFFKDIPRRLGTNEALDSAVCALTTVFPWVRTHQQSAEMIKRYGDALKTLRVCLNDPVKAESAETLCAIYIIIICHGWIAKRDDPSPSHFQAIAHILNTAASRNWRRPEGKFEKDVITTMVYITIMANFGDPLIRLDARLWDQPEAFGPRSIAHSESSIESLEMRGLTKISALVSVPDHSLHLAEIRSTLQELRSDVEKVKGRVSEVSLLVPEGTPRTPQTTPLMEKQSRLQAAYSTILWITITLNAVLRAYEPFSQILTEESEALVDEVVRLASQTQRYRPLGSSFIPMALIVAWAATDDTPRRNRIEEALAIYQPDLPNTNWMLMARTLRSRKEILGLTPNNFRNKAGV